jgi:hypothetical protein
VTGQDGAYLAELLLDKGYIVHGIKRRSSSFNTGRIEHLYEDPHVADRHFILHYGDLTDATNLIRVVEETRPDEIYNLAAQSHVQVSFESAEYTANADAIGTLRLLVEVGGQDPVLSSFDFGTLWQGRSSSPERDGTLSNRSVFPINIELGGGIRRAGVAEMVREDLKVMSMTVPTAHSTKGFAHV